MSAIVLLDTSIYLNILNVPGTNQDRESVFDDFKERIQNGDSFLLPMATIWETGNHIADMENGGNRYKFAKELVVDVNKAIKGESPYRPTYFPAPEEFIRWLSVFPDYAKKNKTDKKYREGISLADLSIIKEWERIKNHHNMSRVLIWSLDSDLQAYDRIMA